MIDYSRTIHAWMEPFWERWESQLLRISNGDDKPTSKTRSENLKWYKKLMVRCYFEFVLSVCVWDQEWFRWFRIFSFPFLFHSFQEEKGKENTLIVKSGLSRLKYIYSALSRWALLGRGKFPPLLLLSSFGETNNKIDTRQINSRKRNKF